MADTTAERKARNDAAFRDANERIRVTVAGGLPTVERLPFICECAERSCTQIIRVRLEDYRAVREHPRRFLVAPGHEEPEVGVVVFESEDYLVVEKTGEAGVIAEQLAEGP